MNLFAVNAAEVNGSIEVWSWYGSADIAVQAGGDLVVGAPLSGTANIQVTSSGQGFTQLKPGLATASIAINSTGEALYGRAASGSSTIQLTTAADGTRWVLGQSASQIHVETEGDAQVVEPVSGTSLIIINSEIEERVTPAVLVTGSAVIELSTWLDEKVGRAVRLEAASQIELATRAIPSLRVNSPAGAAAIAVDAAGAARFGRKVYLEPEDAVIELFVRGELGSLRYVYAEGSSDIAVLAGMLQAGIPPIPDEYVPAPRSRTIIVPSDPRGFSVARENRSF